MNYKEIDQKIEGIIFNDITNHDRAHFLRVCLHALKQLHWELLELGGCDHSVGICYCTIISDVQRFEEELHFQFNCTPIDQETGEIIPEQCTCGISKLIIDLCN